MTETETDDRHKARTNHETVREALNRNEFQEEYGGERLARGMHEGEEILLVAQLKDGKPYLVVRAGGEWHEYPEEEVEDEYVGGVTMTRAYDRVDMLNTGFRALVEKYELEEVDDGEI